MFQFFGLLFVLCSSCCACSAADANGPAHTGFDRLIDGKCLEGVGVEPDIEVPFDIRFAARKDIQLERARDEMIKLIEAPK